MHAFVVFVTFIVVPWWVVGFLVAVGGYCALFGLTMLLRFWMGCFDYWCYLFCWLVLLYVWFVICGLCFDCVVGFVLRCEFDWWWL